MASGLQSAAYLTVDPLQSDVNNSLAGTIRLSSSALGIPGTATGLTFLSTTANTSTFANTVTAQADIDLSPNHALLVGFSNFSASANGFGTLSFTEKINGATIQSQTFKSLAAAESYFHDQLFNLGAATSTIDLRLTFAFTSSTAGASFGASFLTGNSVPGDVNGDGIVNAQDIAVIASHWLQTGTKFTVTGDANADGVVNAQDIGVIASHWLQAAAPRGGGLGSPVPEPSTLILAALGGLALLACRRRIRGPWRKPPTQPRRKSCELQIFGPPALRTHLVFQSAASPSNRSALTIARSGLENAE